MQGFVWLQCLLNHPLVNLSVHLSFYMSVYLSIHPSTHSSIHCFYYLSGLKNLKRLIVTPWPLLPSTQSLIHLSPPNGGLCLLTPAPIPSVNLSFHLSVCLFIHSKKQYICNHLEDITIFRFFTFVNDVEDKCCIGQTSWSDKCHIFV
jgi:hypothetical protein